MLTSIGNVVFFKKRKRHTQTRRCYWIETRASGRILWSGRRNMATTIRNLGLDIRPKDTRFGWCTQWNLWKHVLSEEATFKGLRSGFHLPTKHDSSLPDCDNLSHNGNLHFDIVICYQSPVGYTYADICFLFFCSWKQAVTNEIYVNPLGCSLCKETRAAAIQVGFGLVQPLILVPASAFMFATRHFTYRLPSPIHNRKEFIKVCAQLYRPLKVPMSINVALQLMIAFYITHMEENHFFYLQKAMVNPDAANDVETLAA